jgi:hypothetical protein
MSGVEANADDARWSDIQRRADALNQTLYIMRETAPTGEERLRVDDALAALQAVRLAITAEQAPRVADQAPYTAGRTNTESIQERLRTFDHTLRALRARTPV